MNVEEREYDAGGRLHKRLAANGIDTTIAYRDSSVDKDNLVYQITRTGPLPGANYTYTYDDNKNRTQQTLSSTELGNNSGVFTTDYGYSVPTAGYDDEDRLVAWDRTDGNRDLEWVLTKAGDWSSHTVNSGTPTTRTHDAVHQVTSISTATVQPQHDAKGNITVDGPDRSLAWDFDNRLASVQVGATATKGVTGSYTQFAYDALGRRVKKRFDDQQAVIQTIYVCFDDQVMAEYDLPSGGSPSLEAKYAYGGYIDETVVQVVPNGANEDRFWYHQDVLYNVVAVTTSAGVPAWRAFYDAYGNATVYSSPTCDVNGDGIVNNAEQNAILGHWGKGVSGPPYATLAEGDVSGDGKVDNADLQMLLGQWGDEATISTSNEYVDVPYGFTGRRWDPETALWYYRARYYDSELGRFLARDPIGYAGEIWTRYHYVGAMPTRYLDPLGLKSTPVKPPPSTSPFPPPRDFPGNSWPRLPPSRPPVPPAPSPAPPKVRPLPKPGPGGPGWGRIGGATLGGLFFLLDATPCADGTIPRDYLSPDPGWTPSPDFNDWSPNPPNDDDDDDPCGELGFGSENSCSNYDFSGEDDAFKYIRSLPGFGTAIKRKRRPMDSPSCPDGVHINVEGPGGNYMSIVCCSCCDNSMGQADVSNRCNVH